ncbi:hypothetical protein [Hypericibacter sp.]|uniref:hypothetical protein n=1 Tax=Hypericibacter sp. TaxID=2705401 RepID=UPI003D6D0ABC
MNASEVYVALATLYLRLCGYFTTGLILHSSKRGQNIGEIDCLAIRHPWHNQSARMVDLPPFLDIRDGLIDLILCEVKSSAPAFNEPIRDEANIADVLRWAGVLPEAEILFVASKLAILLADSADPNAARAGIVEGNVRARALLCCPPLKEEPRLWCLTGAEIFRFIHFCMDTSNAPPTCARRYAYELWGEPYSQIVRWFKETRRPESRTLESLCQHMLAPSSTK